MSNQPPSVEAWISNQPQSDRSLELSIIIPAFNEQWRLPSTLIDMVDYLSNSKRSYEIVVVDDGSADATIETVRKFERMRNQIRLLRLPSNSGKGHAVRTGVLNAYGKLILFADADGATAFREIDRLIQAIEAGADVAIGSRAIASKDTTVKTSIHRRLIGRVFNSIVNLLVVPGIADTQCGFKLFTAPVARFLFERQRSNRFSFDVEILLIAQKAGLKIAEIPVNWTNVPGSKVNLVLDSTRMFIDLFRFRLWHRAVTRESYLEFLGQVWGKIQQN